MEPLELGNGRSINNIESYGLLSAVLPTGERFRDKKTRETCWLTAWWMLAGSTPVPLTGEAEWR